MPEQEIAKPVVAAKPTEKPAEKPAEKDHLDDAIERYQKIKSAVGADNVKSFLESMSAKSSPLRAEEKKDEPSAADKANDMRKELEKSHDREFTDRSKYDLGLPTAPTGYGASYIENDWKMKKIDSVDNPALLDLAAWNVIVSANKIMHGFVFNKNNALSRARFPAFELDKTKAPDGKPQYEIFDDSFITIKETVTQTEASMAANGFSSNAIAGSISGGAFGVSAAASVAYNNASQLGSSSSDFRDRREYTATYNFPRARVFVDEHDLTLTKSCQDDVMAIRQVAQKIDSNAPQASLVADAQAKIEAFLTRYGSIFATKFLLGGQLTASKSADSIAGTSDSTKRDEMKWSAAASFSSRFVSGSISGGQEKSSNEATHSSNVNNSSALAWSARGGNTLLAANPAEWANSVASYKSWRTMEQDDVLPLPYLISEIQGVCNPSDKRLDLIFNEVQGYRYRAPTVAKPSGPVAWSGRFKLQATDGTYVKWDGKRLVLSEELDEENALIFRAVDGDIANTQAVPSLTQLPADWPLFLPTASNGTKFSRDTDFNNQVPGLFVDAKGYLVREVAKTPSGDVLLPTDQRTICRWSLNLTADARNNFKDSMNPNSHKVIPDGGTVRLSCHSYYVGFYRSTSQPPFVAPTAYMCKDHGENYRALRIPKITGADLAEASLSIKTGNSLSNFQLFSRSAMTDALFKSDEELMQMVRSFDRKVERDDVSRALDYLRKLFAGSNTDVAKEFVGSTCRTDPVVSTTYPTAEAWNRAYAQSIVDCLTAVVASWTRTERFTDEVLFNVRYVA